MDERSSFVMRTKYENALATLPAEQQGAILMALMSFVVRDEFRRLSDPSAQMLLNVMIEDVQEDKAKYKERCEKNRRSIRKRWKKDGDTNDTNVYERIQTYTNDTNVYNRYRYDNDNDNDSDSDYDSDSYIRPSRPSSYMDDRKNALKNQISDLTKITLSKVGGA